MYSYEFNKITTMRQTDRNRLFQYLKDEHFILVTDKDIDDILEIVSDSTQDNINKVIEEKIRVYRLINVVILTLLNLLLPNFGVGVIMWIFILYNFIHVVYSVIKKRINENRVLQKIRVSRRD